MQPMKANKKKSGRILELGTSGKSRTKKKKYFVNAEQKTKERE